MEWTKDSFRITDDKSIIDMGFVVKSLQKSYWAQDRPRDIIEQSVANSVFLSLFDGQRHIGFNRIVSDSATFAWLCDLIVDPEYRGQGLGKWLFECSLEHPSAVNKINLLATKDAQGLYERYGFTQKDCMMNRRSPW